MGKQLNVRDDEAYRLAHVIADELGKPIVEVVVTALREYGDKLPKRENMTPSRRATYEALRELSRRTSRRKKRGVTSDHSDMYRRVRSPHMIALDTSAIVAIALGEPEEDEFSREIASREALVGTPTLLEVRVVLTQKIDDADAFITKFLEPYQVHPVAFSLKMFLAASDAFSASARAVTRQS